jgi:hypothetical protein
VINGGSRKVHSTSNTSLKGQTHPSLLPSFPELGPTLRTGGREQS